mmetsp:Transcript_23022/g.68467  ORF Transcript_23022/g.68467 Transcript_23022/m.68467 type:complete len:202 (+) Transcript_23022:211-816(+)
MPAIITSMPCLRWQPPCHAGDDTLLQHRTSVLPPGQLVNDDVEVDRSAAAVHVVDGRHDEAALKAHCADVRNDLLERHCTCRRASYAATAASWRVARRAACARGVSRAVGRSEAGHAVLGGRCRSDGCTRRRVAWRCGWRAIEPWLLERRALNWELSLRLPRRSVRMPLLLLLLHLGMVRRWYRVGIATRWVGGRGGHMLC